MSKAVLQLTRSTGLTILLSCAPPVGQVQAQCLPAKADATLDVNQVRARILNDGALFYRAGDGGPRSEYIVPTSEGVPALYGGSIIVGGKLDGEIRVAGSHYAFREFWPGPVQHLPSDSLACERYDQLFEISRSDIDGLERNGLLTENLTDWPWQWGAPVLDGDGNPDNYAPLDGDRPALRGDQMLWWLMNDAAGVKESTDSEALGIEIRGSAFAFETSGALNHATFYDLEIVGERDIEETYLGLWIDGDMGDPFDDYLASDSLLHLGYFYNGSEVDGSGGFGYGSPSPAVGLVLMAGPDGSQNGRDDDRDGTVDEIGEMLGMSSFVCGRKGREGNDAAGYYNALQGLMIDGSPARGGGHYWQAGGPDYPPSRFCFSGDPVSGSFWTPENLHGNGERMAPHDVRFQVNLGPFTLRAGESQRVAFGVIWARGQDRLDSVTQLKAAAAHVREVADVILAPSIQAGLPSPDAPETPLALMQSYPNPAGDVAVFQLSVPQEAHVKLEIVNLLGETVSVIMDRRAAPGPYRIPFDVSGLNPGVYFYRYHLDHRAFTRKMMVVR